MTDRGQETFDRLFGPEFGHGKPFDLARLRAALKALGDPQEMLPPVVHVAGTNGKGSTIAFMRAIAEAAGLRVHAFTKPHLFALQERFTVAGDVAEDAALISAAERVAAVSSELTQFDAQVAAGFLLFSETPADLLLLETGMGGRNDSTNVVARPALTLLTPIGLDHQDALGPKLTDIAAHKAGILKPGTPAVAARQTEEARAVIETRAACIRAQLFRQGVEWDAYASQGRLVVQTQSRALDLPSPALYGAHQADNAGLACAALLAWRELPDVAFAQGVAHARQPARLQPLTRGPFSAPLRALGGEVWVDGAHNAQSASALARALAEMQMRRPGRTVAIVGMRARKDAESFVSALAPAIDRAIAVPLRDAHIEPERIVAICERLGMRASPSPSLQAAMRDAANARPARVLICGSFLLAGEALRLESP